MSESNGGLDFSDLVPFREQFTNPHDNQVYELREASEAVAKQYHNHQLRGTQMTDGKVSKSFEGTANIRAIVVAGCVFGRNKKAAEKGEDKFDRVVQVTEVDNWGSRITDRLFERIKFVSDLDVPDSPEKVEKLIVRLQERLEEMKAAKNPQGAGPVISA